VVEWLKFLYPRSCNKFFMPQRASSTLHTVTYLHYMRANLPPAFAYRLARMQCRYVTVCSVELARGGIKNLLHNLRYKTFNQSTTCLFFTSRQPKASSLLCYNTFAFYPELTVPTYVYSIILLHHYHQVFTAFRVPQSAALRRL